MKTRIAALVMIGTFATAAAVIANDAVMNGAARFRPLVGTWRGTAELAQADKPAMKLNVDIVCREVSGASGVACDTKMASPDMNYLETDLFGYDADAAKVHWYSVTNAGEVHDHVGNWDGAKLMARHTGTSEGSPLTEDVTLDLSQGNMFSFNAITHVGGAQVATISGVLKKR